jgi:hypothetical protein
MTFKQAECEHTVTCCMYHWGLNMQGRWSARTAAAARQSFVTLFTLGVLATCMHNDQVTTLFVSACTHACRHEAHANAAASAHATALKHPITNTNSLTCGHLHEAGDACVTQQAAVFCVQGDAGGLLQACHHGLQQRRCVHPYRGCVLQGPQGRGCGCVWEGEWHMVLLLLLLLWLFFLDPGTASCHSGSYSLLRVVTSSHDKLFLYACRGVAPGPLHQDHPATSSWLQTHVRMDGTKMNTWGCVQRCECTIRAFFHVVAPWVPVTCR